MSGPEQQVVNEIKRYVKGCAKHGIAAFVMKPVDVPQGFPDLIGGFNHPIAVEVKAPGETPRADQLAWLGRLRKAGYDAFWVDSLQGFVEHVNGPHPLEVLR